MTSRERLLAAIKLEKTDRVPVSTHELVGYNSHAFENKEPSYKNLMDFIREKTDCICMWSPWSDCRIALSSYPVQIEYTTKKEADCTETHATVHTPKGALTSTSRRFDNIYTTWQTEYWCKSPEDVDKIMSVPFEPLTYNYSDYPRIRDEVGDRGIIMADASDPAFQAMPLMEFGESTVWVMTETEHYAKVVEEFHRRNMLNLENMLKTHTVDFYRIYGPEYMTPPYLPPSYFKRFVTPYLTEMVDMIHRYGGLVRIHCHGKIKKVLNELLSCGADGLDPCESPPDGDITLRELKERTRGKLCLFGNLQLKMLEHANVREVHDYVRSCMDDAKKGGGYIIMPTAAPINVPLSAKTEENYRVYIETALEYGQY